MLFLADKGYEIMGTVKKGKNGHGDTSKIPPCP